MPARPKHDVAWAAGQHIVEFFAPLLREEEQREAHHQVYAYVMAALEAYDVQCSREAHRLNPSKN